MNVKKLSWILVAVIAVLVLYNAYTSLTMGHNVSVQNAVQEEATRAAKIDIITITDSSCADCYDVSAVVTKLKAENVAVQSEKVLDLQGSEAQALLSTYDIQKIPTLIVTGEIDRNSSGISGLERKDDALIFRDVPPVYYDVATGSYMGRVQFKTIVNSACTDCYDISKFTTALKAALSVSSETSEDMKDASADIAAYNIKELPALIITGDLSLYPKVEASLAQLGTRVGDALVLTANSSPPYWDLASDSIKGLVIVTYITDQSCATCYNVKIHKTVLENYGVAVKNETTVDISSSEGQALVEKYNITSVPTIVVSSDLKYYASLAKVWSQVGVVASDGSYVFTKIDLVSANYTKL